MNKPYMLIGMLIKVLRKGISNNYMNQIINKISRKRFQQYLLIIGIIFYGIFAIIDGPVWFNDSGAYTRMDISREPMYSLFLGLFRGLLPGGNDIYLYVVVVVQGIIAAVAATVMAGYLSDELKLSNVLSLGIYAFPYLVSLLFRFVAGDHFMYSNAILTEGLTVSLHLLFVRFLYEYAKCQSKKSLIWCVVLCFIGINTRKQMMVWLLILTVVVLACNIKKAFAKNIVKSIVICGIVLLSSLLFDRTFNWLVNDQFSGHVNDNRFIATMIFYTADSSDAECIENEELKELYLDIYNSCKEKDLLKPDKNSGMGWFDRSYHFVQSYDQVQLRIMYPMIREKMPELEYAKEIADEEQRLDTIIGYYIDECLMNNIPRMGSVYVDNVLTGFVTSVSQRNRILSIYALLAYIGYFVCAGYLTVYGYKKGYTDELKGILIFSGLVILCILLNVGVVATVIFCQTRYTIYNMSIFYMAFSLMIQYIGRIIYQKYDGRM